MNTLKITDLTIHPMNDFYFDDVSGEKWERLLESIKKNGVRTPIIVTDDMRVVSGNQRVRACKELGIAVINAEIVHYSNENDVIRDLIEINIRQRGVIDDSEIKQGRRFKFLNEYYGVKQGGDHGNQYRTANPNNSDLAKTQEQIASESGISVDTMKNLMKLTEMIPEMQNLLDTGVVNKTTALSIIKKLNEEEQKQLAEQLADGDKVSGSQVKKYIKEIETAKAENEKLRQQISENETKSVIERKRLEQEIEKAKEKNTVVKEVVKEVAPADYADLQSRVKYANDCEKDYNRMKSEYDRINDTLKKAEQENKSLREQIGNPEAEKAENLKRSALFFCAGVKNFIEEYGGYVWLTDEINNMEKTEREGYYRAIQAIKGWVSQMEKNVNGTE